MINGTKTGKILKTVYKHRLIGGKYQTCLETGLSQEILSNYNNKRHATVSDIDKDEVDVSTLAILAHILDKPLGCFYPPTLY